MILSKEWEGEEGSVFFFLRLALCYNPHTTSCTSYYGNRMLVGR